MNWTTEVPKESGWYWVKIESRPEVIYLSPNRKTIWVVADGDSYKVSQISYWGYKLEIPE